jgi:hypothetical protein
MAERVVEISAKFKRAVFAKAADLGFLNERNIVVVLRRSANDPAAGISVPGGAGRGGKAGAGRGESSQDRQSATRSGGERRIRERVEVGKAIEARLNATRGRRTTPAGIVDGPVIRRDLVLGDPPGREEVVSQMLRKSSLSFDVMDN